MAICRLLAVLLLLLMHSIGGFLGAEVKSAIIGGRNADKTKWQEMVYLNITSRDKVTKWRCGGTVLNDQWVLTAASCWDEQRRPNKERSMAWVGSYSLKTYQGRYKGITQIITHRNYDSSGGTYQNDIALVKLKTKIESWADVKYVNLPSANDVFDSSSECWIAGWGYTGANVPLPDPETLQELRIPIIPQNVCKQKHPALTANMLCAGDADGGKDGCKGDYGGPLMCRAASGFVQVGIMSYGNCGLAGQPTIYTSVSQYLSFINENIRRSEETSA
ncbi:tryptase-2-like [Acanthopagrus latus]|uniref:tryptase-2-like n=1 Tax=Acanthopagrus latus TaxID=8177 RepID=UPI00187CA13B|nr:tryptase-2-like [Acanthopagrus latus]